MENSDIKEIEHAVKIEWKCDGVLSIEYRPTTGQSVGYISFRIDELRIREMCMKQYSFVRIKREKEYNTFFIEFPNEAIVRVFPDSRVAVVIPI